MTQPCPECGFTTTSLRDIEKETLIALEESARQKTARECAEMVMKWAPYSGHSLRDAILRKYGIEEK